MATTRGRCTNFDYCTLADSRREVDVDLNAPFVCPECGKPLKAPVVGEDAPGGRQLALVGGAVAILVVGGLLAGYFLLGSHKAEAPAPAVANVAPVVAPAPVEPAYFLRLRGSSALASGLAPALVSAYLTSLGDTGVATAPDMAAAGTNDVAGLHGTTRQLVSVAGGGAADGFAALVGGTADIVLSERPIADAEKSATAALGDLSSPAGAHLVARDAAVVIVNPGTSFGALREDQLHGVFTGGVTQWSQLSAFGQAIQVYVSATDADALVALGIAPGGLVATAKTLPTDAAVEAAVAGDPQGIGLVEYSDAGSAKRLDVTEIGAAPVTATADSITSGDYPYAQPVYLYTATAPQNPAVAPFASFAAGAAGQAVVKKLGFVTTLQAAPPPAPVVPTGPLTPAQKYKLLVAGATRLSTGMSFNPGSYDLDARSLRDMDRVWNMMMSDHTDPSHLILIGFADNQGTPEQNLAISKKRADAVAAIFAGRGLPPGTVVGFGSDLPVADNSTEDGREQNRRVEVYLRP